MHTVLALTGLASGLFSALVTFLWRHPAFGWLDAQEVSAVLGVTAVGLLLALADSMRRFEVGQRHSDSRREERLNAACPIWAQGVRFLKWVWLSSLFPFPLLGMTHPGYAFGAAIGLTAALWFGFGCPAAKLLFAHDSELAELRPVPITRAEELTTSNPLVSSRRSTRAG